MAQQTRVELIDDLDGATADETITFGLDGATYEIDLNEKNASALRDALAPYVGHARKVSSSRRGRSSSARSSSSTTSANGASASEVREWARANGYDVPDRGRIPSDVRSAYDAAH